MTLAELRTFVRGAVNDAADADADLALNVKYKEMAVRARWFKAEKSIGTTVADQAGYAFSSGDAADVQDVLQLRVGTTVYEPVSVEELWGLRANTLSVGHGFAPLYESDQDQGVELFPAPTTAGDSIMALVVLEPAAIVSNGPLIPVDLHGYLAEGAIGDLLARVDEHIGESDRYLSRFEAGVELLAQRATGRIGDGPQQMPVFGKHF